MDPSNPFMGMDPLMLQRLLGQGGGAPTGGGVPGAMPNQMAAGAQMPNAGALGGQMQGDPNKADRLQKLGKLLTAMGQFHTPPKPQAQAPQPMMAQPPQMPQGIPPGAGGMQRPQQMQMPMQARPPMPQMQGMGMPRPQVPPPDVMNRLLSSLSQYGG